MNHFSRLKNARKGFSQTPSSPGVLGGSPTPPPPGFPGVLCLVWSLVSTSSAVWVTFVKNYKKFCSPCHFLYRTASKMGCKNPKEVPQREINGIGQRIHAIHATSSLSCRSCIKQWSTILIFFWHLRARHLFLISPSSNAQLPKNRVPKKLYKDKNIERNKTIFFLVMSFLLETSLTIWHTFQNKFAAIAC